MMKRPFNFVCGIICGICLLANIIMEKGLLVIIVALIATIVNFMVAFTE